ncbi:hypothetical protein [Thermoanaerobacterium thermosaccharolyticum]|uniref:hypothetical protein n=1 Tax=Thermoanaerobacterium thermosaccharolyticum TaxID=1517 RepID=UPI003DA9E96B
MDEMMRLVSHKERKCFNLYDFFIFVTVLFITVQSFVIFNVGKFGIQISLLTSIIGIIFLFFNYCVRNRINIKVTKADFWLILLYLVELISIFINLYRNIDINIDVHLYIVELSGGIIYLFFRLSINNYKRFKYAIKIFILSANISAIYGIYQVIAFKYNLVGGLLLRNNSGLTMVNSTNILRAFAFTAEPSNLVGILLSAHIISLIMYINNRKIRYYKYSTYISLLGSLFTASQVLIILPFFYLYILILYNYSSKIKEVFKVIICMFSLMFIIFMIWPNIFQIINQRIFDYFNHFINNNSNYTRLGTVISGIRIFLNNPLFGAGVGNANLLVMKYYPKNISIMYNIQTMPILNNKTGFDSFFVAKLAQSGLFGIIALIGYIFSCINFNLKNQQYEKVAVNMGFLLIFTVLIFTVYNASLYYFWFLAALSVNSNLVLSNKVGGVKNA